MHKIFAVIRREVLTRVRTRMFLIGTILGPILLASLVVLPVIIAGRDRDARRIVVLDTDGSGLGARVELVLGASRRGDRPDGQPRYIVTRVEAQGRVQAVLDSLVARTGLRDLGAASPTGIVVVGDEALVTDTLRYFGANAQSEADMRVLGATLATAVRLERLAREGVDPAVVGRAMLPIEVTSQRVSQGRLTGESGESSFILAYAMLMILYITLLLYGQQMMTTVIEEKSSRINEILVSSLRPFELLLGKVVGVGAVALLQVGIWAGAAFLLARYRLEIATLLGATPDAMMSAPIPAIPPDLLVVFLLFFVLGFLLYSALFAAVGATCSSLQEVQQAAMPVTLLIAGGFIVVISLLDDPNGSTSRIMGLVPLYAPFVTPVRWSLDAMSLGELLLSLLVTVLGVLGVAWIAGRIYRTGMLMYGKRPSLAEIWRWVRVG
jgi:ABC-2 type transport system permease protein